MTDFSTELARTELTPVWVAEFSGAEQTVSALAAAAVTPAEIGVETAGQTFSAFPNTGYAVLSGGGREEIVRYGGKSADGSALTGVARGRFSTRLRDWPAGTVLREYGLDRPFATRSPEAFPDARPVLLEPSVTRQSLDDERLTSSVTSFSFRLSDQDSAITALLTLTPLRDRMVTLKLGFPPLAAPDDYRTVARGRVRSIASDDGRASWRFQCRGLFGELKDRPLFPERRSRLGADVTASQTSVPVEDLSRFLNNTDSPVRYARIGDEIVSYTGRSGSSGPGNLTGCTRGEFLSVPATHSAGEEITQLYELSGHPLDVLLRVLTTTDTGGNGSHDVPAHRGGAALGLDAALVDTAGIEAVRDSYLPGCFVRFAVEDESDDAKRWIEEELLRACGVVLTETGDAKLGVRFLGPPSPVEQPLLLGAGNLCATGERFDLGLEAVRNVIEIRYSADPVSGEFLERVLYIDADSVSRHGAAPKLTVELRGLHGNRSPLGDQGGDALAERLATRLALHLAAPRARLRAEAPFQMLGVPLGAVVSLDHARLPGAPDESRPLTETVREPGERLVEVTGKALGQERVTLELRESPFAPLRYAFIQFDGAPDYGPASAAHRQYAYLSADTGSPADPNSSALPFADGGPPYAMYPA